MLSVPYQEKALSAHVFKFKWKSFRPYHWSSTKCVQSVVNSNKLTALQLGNNCLCTMVHRTHSMIHIDGHQLLKK